MYKLRFVKRTQVSYLDLDGGGAKGRTVNAGARLVQCYCPVLTVLSPLIFVFVFIFMYFHFHFRIQSRLVVFYLHLVERISAVVIHS